MSRSIVIAAVVLMSAGTAHGQVVVENLFVPTLTPVSFDSITGFTDMPESQKTVSIPAGTAVIQWELYGTFSNNIAEVRPVIGDTFPAEGLLASTSTTGASGTWVGHTDGGTMTVKLQVKPHNPVLTTGISYGTVTSLSWTLTVFPDAGPVPAVSTVGLGIMVVLLLVGGTVVLRRRQRQAA